jgi:uncharacterized protein YdaU (DUF1376 family)
MRGLIWWIDRWRGSSAYIDLTVEQQGMYRNLLDECCLRDGGIPNDDRVLAKASGDPARWPKMRKAVMKRFTLVDGVWRNGVLDHVVTQATRNARRQAAYRARKKAADIKP